MQLSLCQYHTALIIVTLQYVLKFGNIDPSSSISFFPDCFGCSKTPELPYEIYYQLVNFRKNFNLDFGSNYIESEGQFGVSLNVNILNLQVNLNVNIKPSSSQTQKDFSMI